MNKTIKSVKTGIYNLDELFGGGFLDKSMIIVEGTPGTGKTTFVLQYLIKGALEYGEPGVLVTFEQSFEKLKRDCSSFGWDLQDLVDRKLLKVIYTSPTVFLKELQTPDSVLARDVADIKAKRLALDGLAPIRLSIGDHSDAYRENLLVVFETLGRMGLTTAITNELTATPTLGDSNFSHEQFLCDTLITLRQDPQKRGSTHRSIEVAKSRAQKIASGRHSLEIHDDGISIFPRAQAPENIAEDQVAPTNLKSVGVKAIDDMLGGGLYEGSVSLVVGITGTGKSIISSHFSTEAVNNDERVLYVTLDEHPQQLLRNAATLGFKLKEAVDNKKILLRYCSPLELNMDKHLFQILKTVDEEKVDRVVIDSISAYQPTGDAVIHDFIYALATQLKNRSVTTLFVYENPEMIGISQISEDFKVSPIVDNIILFNYVEISNRLRRAITIPKSRGLKPSRTTREFVIAKGGIKVLTEKTTEEDVEQLPFSAYFGILGRAPQRLSPYYMNGDDDKQKATNVSENQ